MSTNTEEIQKLGLAEAKKIKHISVFIMPMESKMLWENCALVLASKSDEELERHYCRLFEWLQDMNSPGAYIVYNRLLEVNPSYLKVILNHALMIAKLTMDKVWYQVLCEFQQEYEEIHVGEYPT